MSTGTILENKELKWRYYNHALLPICAPHEEPDIEVLKEKNFWKTFKPNRPLFACWTTHFDCEYKTDWWYCILDKPFDISTLKSRRQTRLNQALNYFDIRIIDVALYAEQMFNVHKISWETYHHTGKFHDNKDLFCKEVKNWKDLVFAAFDKETGEMATYYRVKVKTTHIDLVTLKTNPRFEQKRVNQAIMFFVYEYFRKDIEEGKYLCGGTRNIYHQTNFQEFRERNFGFRKAYVNLHLQYAPCIGLIINLLYPFRKILGKMSFKIANQINGVLFMEEICRKQRKKGQ